MVSRSPLSPPRQPPLPPNLQLTRSFPPSPSCTGHVGASVYIHWILDSAEAEEMTLDSLTTLDIEYKQECFLNERIECYTQKSDSSTNQGTEINHLIQTNEGKVLLRAKSVWN